MSASAAPIRWRSTPARPRCRARCPSVARAVPGGPVLAVRGAGGAAPVPGNPPTGHFGARPLGSTPGPVGRVGGDQGGVVFGGATALIPLTGIPGRLVGEPPTTIGGT